MVMIYSLGDVIVIIVDVGVLTWSDGSDSTRLLLKKMLLVV